MLVDFLPPAGDGGMSSALLETGTAVIYTGGCRGIIKASQMGMLRGTIGLGASVCVGL